ncbi:MAG TPA: choice-of-anchor Q domain-containing protein, partial [Chloroflexaceae bacterium]|nr:choice-of-anchor Q domain-containing protein [Chloroflexaceae bacterium]
NMLAPAGGCGGGTSDRLAADPGLEALANNGGPSPTHALTAGSLALDGGGGPACPAADQRGVARPQGAACDSGAFEREAGPAALVVTTAADSGEGSLRAAIEAANARPGPDMIGFAIAGSPVITPASPLPPLTGPTAIEGLTQPGATALAPTVTLDGGLLADDADGLVLVGGASSVQGLIITGFGGAGISVPAGEGATLRGNRFSRNGLAIDLGADGPTPNGLALDVEEAEGGILIAGGLDAAPGVYTVDLYASATCRLADGGEGASPRLSGPGDGETLLGTVAAAAGAPFSLSVADPALAGTWISAIATDAAGNTSEFSACAPIRANDLWTNALPIELLPTGAPGGAEGAASQSISRPYQERWYRFPVGPGGRVRVELAGAPGSILTLHRDLERVYGQLSRPQSAELLAADEQTTGFLPGAYLPGAYLPGAYLPGAYLPGAYLPGAYLPGAYLPGAYLPGAYLPGAYLPGAYLPGAYLPGAYLPGAYLPEQYAAAARASLMAFAADPAADRLTIERNTWDLAENLYVRVVAPEGTDFAVAVSFQGGICSDIRAPDAGLPTIAGGPIAPDTFQTLILWDAASVPDADEPVLLADLAAFAGRPEVDGLLVNLSQPAAGGPRFPRAAAARATLAANTSCVAAANLLAGEIKAVADAHRAAYPGLRYIVLVGGDEAIPFFRYPDVAGLANESEYFPPVEELSAANAALREGRVSGQDAYGTSTFIRRGAYELPVPDLAVGRLVGDAATVRGMLAAYAGAAGLVSPRSALVSGYDFVADGAEAVFADLQAGLSAPGGPTVAPERLIQPEGLGPDDPSAWSADDLRARLLDPAVRNDMVFFTGHFAAGSALAADYATSLLASEVAESGADFTNTILFGLGCHSGYNVPAPGAIPGFSPEPDWPAAWARAGATYIAATGFAYGDTELVEYGERLLLNISQAMRTGDGPVAVGEAVVRAKQDYLAQKAALSGIDEKTLLQFVLYGLPMLQVDLPGKLTAPGAPQLVDGVRDVTAGTPGAALGLRVGTSGGSEIVTVNSSPLRRSLTLTDTDGSRVEAVYYEGPGGAVVANPTEPLLPLERREVDVSGPGGPQVLRGVGFRGGAFEERAELALTSAPATENARGFLKFLGDTFYPSQPWSANHLDALRGGAARLMVVPAQYRAEPGGASAYRVFSSMQFKLFYLDADWPASDRRAAGLAPAPEIAQVASERLPDGRVAFSAFVVNGAAGVAGSRLGVQEVWVTYSEPGSGRWESVDLRPDPADPTRWVGPAGGVSLADGTAFMVQAAGAAGKVSLDTNSGAYYTVPPLVPGEPPGAPRDTAIVAVALPASGAYGARVGFTVRLVDGGGAALSGRGLRLFLGGQVALATTDAAGQAGFALDLAQPPGAYPLLVTYGGEAGYRSARLTGAFTIVPAATTLALAPAGSVTTVTGAPTGLVATLRTAAGGPIADATVLFVAEGAGGPLGAAAKTNLDGRAVLGSVPWPDGSYTVTAYFAGNGSPPTGGPANPASVTVQTSGSEVA